MDDITSGLLNLNINKGTGAGGKNTNLKGKNFEEITNSEKHLIGYIKNKINDTKYGYFFQKELNDEFKTSKNFMLQSGLKAYFKKLHNIEIFRFPDEAFVIQDKDKMDIYIIEKKEQSVEGSVETKLWSSPSLKREYEIIFQDKLKHAFKIHYILCVNSFLENKFETNEKYKVLKRILEENDIKVLYGDNEKYFETLREIVKF
jgi:hypothetical protein